MLAVYVSGHGYGHAARTAEVLREVRRRSSRLTIAVRTTAPAFLFESAVGAPLTVEPVECDVGLVQQDALVIDEVASAAAWRAFQARWDERVETEAGWLRGSQARLVLGDIPPLAFAAAAVAGTPAVAFTNFSWDWIYRHLAAREAALGEAATRAREAYGTADLLLRLPFSGDLSAFRRVLDLPLVARRPRVAKAEARRRLGLDARPAVLLSFGGIGLPGLEPGRFSSLRACQLLLTGTSADGPIPSNLRRLGGDELAAVGLGYVDLVGAADVVVSKPGYGIVSDCIGARTRLVYTDRGDFPEYPVLVDQMPHYLPTAFVPNHDLREGRIGAAVQAVLGRSFPDPPRTDGASVAAEELLARL
jgi:hypothetical protein